ncbi:transcriptional activator NhaR [Pseudomonas sp. RIT-PI-S]|uniref:transcriptional activator NhaR n=1 Tax=Pseudomonas sp. RIT-PI-S TaxID=3035295 RepID=UPI0021D81291|nr:transcriptional activator NhaR [Pseudomonas sp. RIT-PI-S]
MLNYRQLHYFWMVARTGSITRACEQLNLTAPTISGQLSLLEGSLGLRLFQKVGRHLELTEDGRRVLTYAEPMFEAGAALEAMIRAQPGQQPLMFRVGVADVVPKSIVYRLLAPTMAPDALPLRLTCREDKLERLLADLAIQRLDLVISDSPVPPQLDIKSRTLKLGECGIGFFATQRLAKACTGPFPACLENAPLLIPGSQSVVRGRLLRWLEDCQVNYRVVGEFDDSALMQAFGLAGSGVFVAPRVIADDLLRQGDLHLLGETDAVAEAFYAISVERRVNHPGILAVAEGARLGLFQQ